MEESTNTRKFTLNSAVILRSEPQYYDTYAAFDCRNVRTEFLKEQEYRALEPLYSKSVGVNKVSKKSGIEYRK